MENSSSSINVNTNKQLSGESVGVFREGINLIFSSWSALELAISNEWAGRGSTRLADQLASDIFSWFTQSKEPLYIDDLEEILDEGMVSLNTMIEDGSIEEVAERLMIMHEECLEGNYNSIDRLRNAGPRIAAQHVRQDMDDDDDDDEDKYRMSADRSNMMVEAPEFQPRSNPENVPVDELVAKEAQAEDGWVVVSSRRNRGKRN